MAAAAAAAAAVGVLRGCVLVVLVLLCEMHARGACQWWRTTDDRARGMTARVGACPRV